MDNLNITPGAVLANPTAVHHLNLQALLQIILTLAPAVAAPFIPADGQAAFAAESSVAAALAQALSKQSIGSL